MKNLKVLAVAIALGFLVSGCRYAALGVAGGVIGAAIIAHAFNTSQVADVAKESIRAKAVSDAACNLGGKGTANYESSEGFSEIRANGSFTPKQCERIRLAREQADADKPIIVHRDYTVYERRDSGYRDQPRYNSRGYREPYR